MKNKVLVVDLELTCWEKPTNLTPEIIQIGIVEVNFVTQKITRERMMYVKPKNSDISEYCTNLTGITNKQVFKQGLELEQAFDILKNKFGISNKLVVGWGRDDIALKPIIDEYLNLSYIYGITKREDRKFKLKEALEREGLQFDGTAHDALVDARNTAKLFIHLFKK